MKKKRMKKIDVILRKIAAEASWVVDAFDQADTGEAIRLHGTYSSPSRRQILINAIDDLRSALRGTEFASSLPTFDQKGRPTPDEDEAGKKHLAANWKIPVRAQTWVQTPQRSSV